MIKFCMYKIKSNKMQIHLYNITLSLKLILITVQFRSNLIGYKTKYLGKENTRLNSPN